MSFQYGICHVSIAPVRSQNSDQSEIVTQLLFGDYVKILAFERPWAHVYFAADDYEGWMDFKQLFFISEREYEEGIRTVHPIVQSTILKVNGLLGDQQIIFGSNLPYLQGNQFRLGSKTYTIPEKIPAFTDSLTDTAMRYLNTPYLWGGKGIFGIDCSGFTQIVAKAHGILLPRDASQQCQVGEGVMFNSREQGDLMYFVNKNGSVHHVGIVLSPEEIIHASGHVRIDKYDQNGIFRTDFDDYTHQFHSIKRIWIR